MTNGRSVPLGSRVKPTRAKALAQPVDRLRAGVCLEGVAERAVGSQQRDNLLCQA